ncbi:Single-stranded DNA-binding protein [Candidatus Roizmanbacteria bacterium]|nr:Single-stranded DNA-binding protein [Candidatus Roizmanbacteria bacterium]
MSSRSLNRIVLIGNLTRDPELKYTPTGTAVCTFSIATNRSWTSSDGQAKEEVQYHRVVAWQKLAELCGKLLNKGRKVFAEGRMTYRTFTGKDGILRTIAEIVLDDFIVFGEGRGEKKLETTVLKSEELPTKHEEVKSETSKEETVNPDDIPF